MGALNSFLGKPREIEICNVKVTIYPLKVKDIAMFSKESMTKEEQTEASKKMIKLSIPDATDEEIDNLSIDAFIKIMEAINELNGFKDEHIRLIKEKAL